MRWLFLFAGVSGMCSVALGAFGAHSLRDRLPEQMMRTFQTAVDYQMYHSLALLITCYLALQWSACAALRWSAHLFAAGIICFSGSLYLLSTLNLMIMGPITPIGGLMFIMAWLFLTVGIWESTRSQSVRPRGE
jgi:uncharacterized membrane protein YgdD (TMEM256/DUF423 family)